jgi:threonine dehydratase
MEVKLDFKEQTELASKKIRSYIRETYLEKSLYLSEMGKTDVYCKMENLQITGSFKIRGALNAVFSLPEDKLANGVVAASTGNHGLAVAFASQIVGTSGTVFVPVNTPQSKVDAIKRLGSEVQYHGSDCVEAEQFAREYANQSNKMYISPYNDQMIIYGQGTIGVELTKQLDKIDAVFVTVGGGGLISGIAGYLKSINRDITVYGCSPKNSDIMARSVKAGKILKLPSLDTLSEGSAGGVEPNAITFNLCSDFVDEWITVTENEIANSLKEFIQNQHFLIEGAAAVALASYKKKVKDLYRNNVVIIICGSNISALLLKQVLSNY